jgi:hypothetical protein
MPRFVVLRHETPSDYVRPTHFDVMFEDASPDGDVKLLTFAVPLAPDSDHAQLVERIADHRIEYLTMEGPVGGNRGSVTRVDQGTFEWIDRTNKRWQVRVTGKRLRGVLRFDRVASEQIDVTIGESEGFSEAPTIAHSTNGRHATEPHTKPTSAERWMMWFLIDDPGHESGPGNPPV